MQTQIFVCELCYCDLFVYCPPKYAYERVLPSEACHKEIVEKSKVFFVRVILPELIAKYFSLHRVPHAPNDVNCDNETVNVCYCQTPRRDPMVTCAGERCTFKEFHCRCVDLRTAPKRDWFCDQCRQ